MNTHPEAFGFRPSQEGTSYAWPVTLNDRSHAAFREKALMGMQNSGANIRKPAASEPAPNQTLDLKDRLLQDFLTV